MKKMIVALGLMLSLNTFAASLVWTVLEPTAWMALSSLSTSENLEKEAAKVVNDSQLMLQGGKITAFLNQKIKDIQAMDPAVSDAEALDALLEVSEQILK